MAMRVMDNESIQKAMKGYCRVCVNLSSFDPDSVVEVINGVSTTDTTGRFVGGLVGEPSFASEDELIVFTENIHGAQGPYKGGWQIQSTTSSITATLMKLSYENFKMIFPDLEDRGAWASADSSSATLTIGTGASGVTYTAKSAGTAGNSIRVAHVNPGTANAALSVTVSGNDITVNLATDNATTPAVTSTAAQVRDAVNASAAASALVGATLAGDGTGTAVTQVLTALAGGAGTSYGRRVARSGNVLNSAYFDNAALIFEGATNDEVGMIMRLNSVTNVADSKEFSPDGGGNISGVEVQLQGHQDLENLSSGGEAQPPCEFYLPSYEGASV